MQMIVDRDVDPVKVGCGFQLAEEVGVRVFGL